MWLKLVFVFGLMAQLSHQQKQQQQQQQQQSHQEPKLHKGPAISRWVKSGMSTGLEAADQTLWLNLPSSSVNGKILKKDPTYFIIASQILRPGHTYRTVVHLLDAPLPVTIKLSIMKNGAEVLFTSKVCHAYVPEIMQLKIPITLTPDHYKLRLEGSINGVLGGIAFYNETDLQFGRRSITLLIQTDRPIYKQGQTVHFRALPINTDLKLYSNPIDVYMLDPKGYVVKRWMSRQQTQGAVTLSYELPQQLTVGLWTIRVVAYGQQEEKQFVVEEFYQSRFDVSVKMSPFFLESGNYVHGVIEANYTNGSPVTANLTIHISVHPPRVGLSQAKSDPATERFIPEFRGIYNFKIAMWELESLASKLDGMQVTIFAVVGDRITDKKIEGFSSAIIANGDIKLKFLGSQPQAFKAGAPFKTYVVATYHDDSPLSSHRLKRHKFELQPTIVFIDGHKQQLDSRQVKMLNNQPGIWEIEVDLKSEPSVSQLRLQNVKSLKLEVKYKDNYGGSAETSLVILNYYSPNNNHLSVTTSTKTPKVGEYIVFHVRADFYVLEFYYLILSKGLVLSSGTESITSSIRTFALTLHPSMVPSATIIVYYLSLDGDVIADSLTFPVNGFSRNSFNLTINNHKSHNGIQVAVRGKPGSVVGLSSLSLELYRMQAGNEINHHFMLGQMKNFDNGKRIQTLHQHTWVSRDGFQSHDVHFSTFSYAPDANRTFEYLGLLVFTDANLTANIGNCSAINEGLGQCVSGDCYQSKRRCDGEINCEDGSDEAHCPTRESFNLKTWRLHRHNRIKNHFEDTWLWQNIVIGPRGVTTVNVTLPERPAEYWMISAFSLSKSKGLGILENPFEWFSNPPFYMTLEMPSKCKLGEQLGIRAVVFNNKPIELQVSVILASSADYTFVSMADNSDNSDRKSLKGSRRSSNLNGERHHPVTVNPMDSVTTYIPITPLKLGEINVTIMAQTETQKYTLSRILRVEPEGITQYRQSSILLDLNNRAYLISYFDVNLTDSPTIPYSKDLYYVDNSNIAQFSVFGDVVGPAFLPVPINVSSLLRNSDGCAEQNMFNFAINLYMLKYMRNTNQRDLVREKEMFHYMNLVYARQLSYQTVEGAFTRFRWRSTPNVWLTAFCARIFREANYKDWENFLYIDPYVISQAVGWLLQFQTPYGAFYESPTYDQKANKTCCLKWNQDNGAARSRNISLTAHVVLTLHSVKDMPGPIGLSASKSLNLAVNYMERMLPAIRNYDDPYELAIVAHALTVVGSGAATEAFNYLGGKGKEIEGMMYWGREAIPPPKYNIASNKPYLQARLPYRHDANNIETTAYALMVFVAHQALMQEPIVQWLNFQRLSSGGWASNQDTMVAYQALLEYSASQAQLREATDISIAVDSSSSPGFEKIFTIQKENLAQLQTVEIPNAWGTVRLVVKGSGMAVAQLAVQYNVNLEKFLNQPPTPMFSVVMEARYDGHNASHMRIRSCQRWTAVNESDISNMVALEIDIPTGYCVQQDELNAYLRSGKVKALKSAHFQEGRVVFYFDHLDASETCVDFVAERSIPVANLTKFLGVKVYDYYAPERFNQSLFEAVTLHELNICQVCGSYQCPYCPVFNAAKSMSFHHLNACAFLVLTIAALLCLDRISYNGGAYTLKAL